MTTETPDNQDESCTLKPRGRTKQQIDYTEEGDDESVDGDDANDEDYVFTPQVKKRGRPKKSTPVINRESSAAESLERIAKRKRKTSTNKTPRKKSAHIPIGGIFMHKSQFTAKNGRTWNTSQPAQGRRPVRNIVESGPAGPKGECGFKNKLNAIE